MSGLGTTLAVVLLAASPAASTEPAPRSRAHLVVGSLIRVDLGRRTLTVRPDGGGAELEIQVDSATRVVREGRVETRGGLRPDEAVKVRCEDGGPGRHRAVRVKAGRTSYAPSPRPD